MTTLTPAIEIKSQEVANYLSELVPHLKELDYETRLKNHFLVFGYPEGTPGSLIAPEDLHLFCDSIQNGTQVTLKYLVKLED